MSRAALLRALGLAPCGAAWAAVLAAVLACGCAGPEGGTPAPSASATGACAPCACSGVALVDPALIAFLSKARAAHHEADIAEQRADRAGAVRALLRLADGPVPGAPAPAPEVREVLADTRARLAELHSADGRYELADADIAAGLALAVTPTHFRGRLLEVRGLVEERRAAALEREGDRDGANSARDRAVAAYEAAMDVQEQVIQAQLGDAGAPGAGPATTDAPPSGSAPR